MLVRVYWSGVFVLSANADHFMSANHCAWLVFLSWGRCFWLKIAIAWDFLFPGALEKWSMLFSVHKMVLAVGCAFPLFLPLFKSESVYGKGLQCDNIL